MDFAVFSQINYAAVLVSAALFFAVGSVWFSGLFGSLWKEELIKHNVRITEPTSGQLAMKMLLTFVANILAAYAMACLVMITHSSSLQSGLVLGGIAAVGFAATTLASCFIWENRSLKLFLIDVGYPIFGIIVSAVILSLWR